MHIELLEKAEQLVLRAQQIKQYLGQTSVFILTTTRSVKQQSIKQLTNLDVKLRHNEQVSVLESIKHLTQANRLIQKYLAIADTSLLSATVTLPQTELNYKACFVGNVGHHNYVHSEGPLYMFQGEAETHLLDSNLAEVISFNARFRHVT
jgi:hypothetical protein